MGIIGLSQLNFGLRFLNLSWDCCTASSLVPEHRVDACIEEGRTIRTAHPGKEKAQGSFQNKLQVIVQ